MYTDINYKPKKYIVCERIRRLRIEQGKAQDVVAQLCGIRQATLSNYENGKALPSTESLFQLAVYFGVSADYLLGLSDTKKYRM